MDGRGQVVVSTNSEGFRATREPANDLSNILVIGDSYTFGVYVNDDETYPSIIDKSLGMETSTRVLNAGYTSGFDTDQQYAWLQQNFKIIKPRVLIWGVFLGNDILGIRPSAWRDLDHRGLPKSYYNQNIYVDNFGYIKSIYANSLNTVGIEFIYKIPVLRDVHIAVAVGKLIDKIKNYFSYAKTGYSPNGFNNIYLKHIYGRYDPEFIEKETLFIKLLVSARDLCENNNCKFLIALHPINFMVDNRHLKKILINNDFEGLEPVYYDRLGEILTNNEIEYINLYDHMKNSDQKFFPDNGEVHYNFTGNEFAGNLIADYIKENFRKEIFD
tara:strand:- start:282 stop:1268 length:987 start_codon:yes stop_codon:yes gene_type:complete